MTTPVKPLKVDTRRADGVVLGQAQEARRDRHAPTAADVIPPCGQAAGVKFVRIDWGDGSGYVQARKADARATGARARSRSG